MQRLLLDPSVVLVGFAVAGGGVTDPKLLLLLMLLLMIYVHLPSGMP